MSIKDSVSKFIDDYGLKNRCVLVGFSGGYDSMCLLDVLSKLQADKMFSRLVAVHYNHNWRGEKAKLEQEVCRNFCEVRNIEFYTETAPDNIKKNETEARELRYEFFERAIKKFSADALMTAHNFDDNAETIIYRITKGTGIVGLKGILAKRGHYYRPLLNIERKSIEEYSVQNNLSPNYDNSNDDTQHKRNLIRHDIIPLLEKINPDVKNAINTLSQISISEIQIIDEYLDKLSKDLYDGSVIKTSVFKTLSAPVKQKIIYNLLYSSEYDYSMETVLNVLEFIEETIKQNKPSKYSVGKNGWIYTDSNIIELIQPEKKSDEIIKIITEGEYSIANQIFKIEKTTEYEKTGTETIAYVDLNSYDELYLRTRRDGDIIYPLGSSGCMKLKKYFISKKIPQYRRDNIVLLVSNDEVLWVSGVGLSDKIKVKDKPTHRLSIRSW